MSETCIKRLILTDELLGKFNYVHDAVNYAARGRNKKKFKWKSLHGNGILIK